TREAVRWSNGLRTWTWTYRDLYRCIAAFAKFLEDRDLRKGDRVLIWGENRLEWIAAFWGGVVRGVEVVPVDFRFSSQLVRRIAAESNPVLLVHGNTVEATALALDPISFDEIALLDSPASVHTVALSPEDVVEIVYTSGTTGQPKGVIHRHRNICSN